MSRSRSERGSIITIVIGIALILGLIALGYYAIINKGSSTANDTISANCQNLTLSKGSSSGTAGTIYWHAVITNNGDYICRLTGYPAAFMNDASTHKVGATSNSLYPPATIVLGAHGGQAHTVIGLPEPGNFSSGITCTDKSTSVLQLFLPGLSIPVTTDFGESACPSYTITALQPGA